MGSGNRRVSCSARGAMGRGDGVGLGSARVLEDCQDEENLYSHSHHHPLARSPLSPRQPLSCSPSLAHAPVPLHPIASVAVEEAARRARVAHAPAAGECIAVVGRKVVAVLTAPRWGTPAPAASASPLRPGDASSPSSSFMLCRALRARVSTASCQALRIPPGADARATDKVSGSRTRNVGSRTRRASTLRAKPFAAPRVRSRAHRPGPPPPPVLRGHAASLTPY